jgi:hypothetical protein
MLEARVRQLEHERAAARVWDWIELVLYGIVACVELGCCVGSSDE